MATRKKPAGRAAASRKTSKEAARAQALQQVWAIVLFAVGMFLGALSLLEGEEGTFWLWLHQFYFGLFGFAAIFIAPLFVYIAVMATLDKPLGDVGTKVWQCLVVVALISSAIQVFSGPVEADGLIGLFATLYENGKNIEGGGVVSGVIGVPLLYLGATGAKIIIVLLIFVFVMLFTGGTLIGLYKGAIQPVKKMGENYTAKVQERAEYAEAAAQEPPAPKPPRRRFNVDIPLDGETPPAPAEEAPPAPAGKRQAPKPPPAQEPMPEHPVQFEGEVPQGSFARQALERLEQQDSTRDALYSAARPAGRFQFDIKLDEDAFGSDVRTADLPAEPDLQDIAGPETVLHFREPQQGGETAAPAPEAPPPPAAQTTDEAIAEILGRAAPGLEQDAPDAQEPAAPAPRDEIEEKLRDGLNEAFGESAGHLTANERFAEEFGAPQEYCVPSVSLLQEPARREQDMGADELKANAQRLVDTLKSFGVQTRIIDIAKGPAVTRYELQPSAGVKISKITSLADDIALNLAAAGVRIEAPIPNKPAVGIEVPNKKVSMVHIREIIDSQEFVEAKSPLTMALGRDISGKVTVADIAKMPHMLIAGATGSGKSVCINSIIISLLYKASPDEVKLLMVDPKVVELGIYNGIPHLLVPVVTDPKKAAGALAWAVNEMLGRYKLFADNSVRDIGGFNRLCKSRAELHPMPQIVIIIDELADLMMAAPNEVEDYVCRLAQMARAAGMHLIIATQRPSVDVITGVIKANIPSRIAFAVSSSVDSRTILDSGGAEKLLGRGDMLFYPVGTAKPMRVQGCFVSDQEVEKVVGFIKNHGEVLEYDAQVMEEIERQAVVEKKKKGDDDGGGFPEEDEMLPAAIECVIEMGMASTSMLQRKLKLGYARAARLIDELEQKGIVGPFEGSKPRQVLITRDQWYEMKMNTEE